MVMSNSDATFRRYQYDHDRACPPDAATDTMTRDELVERGICPDCCGHGCQACSGSGQPPRCVQCDRHVDPRRVVRAVENYCPACAAKEIEALYQSEAQLEAEVARLKGIIDETAIKIGQMVDKIGQMADRVARS